MWVCGAPKTIGLMVVLCGLGCTPAGGTLTGAGPAAQATQSQTTSAQNAAPGVPAASGAPGNAVVGLAQPTTDLPTTGTHAVNTVPVDLGPNVLVFDANMSMAAIQAKLDSIYDKQASNEFGPERYAYLFKPGAYALDVQIGYFTTALGLGLNPDAVTVTGAVRAKAAWNGGNGTLNFWRGAENLAIVPTQDNGRAIWAVSQATFMRRVHVKGAMNLSDDGWVSGGFIADSVIDISIDSGTQQQFLTRNCNLGKWQGSNWNMVFVGDNQAPAGTWPQLPYSVLAATPRIREKPFLALDANGAYAVAVPRARVNAVGPSWTSPAPPPPLLPMTSFYVGHANVDTATSLNAALAKGLHLLLTPGTYKLDKPLEVSYKNTIVLGLGFATLAPQMGTAALTVADVDGVTLSGVIVDAGPTKSPTMVVLGAPGAQTSHAANPTVVHDLFCRVGGAGPARTESCLVVHMHDAILDNTWLWRADHGNGAGWDSNPSETGLIVNGANVSAYGLFVEHFAGYQTLWNGNNGEVYMYQSEFPYDVPNQAAWTHGGVNGYASYKVDPKVTQHKALGLGMYCVFHNSVVTDNAIEAPVAPGVSLNHMITEWLGVADGSSIGSILNGAGGAANAANRQAQSGL